MKRIKFILGSLFSTLAFVPALALAQQNLNLSNNGISGLLVTIGSIMNLIIPILIGLAVVAFLWGVLKFVFNASDEEKRKEGKNFIIWGIVGIAVMVSVWGLVQFVQRTFGVNSGGNSSGTGYPTVMVPTR